jgi:RNA recognition motif-containing protein
VGTPEAEVYDAFVRFGTIEDIRIIRKGGNGQPLKESVYGFVVMRRPEDAAVAISSLTDEGWSVRYSKETIERQQKTRVEQELTMPSLQAFHYNMQATQIMLSNNGTGLTVDQVLSQNHPSAFNLKSAPQMFAGCFLVREVWIGNIFPSTEKKTLFDVFKVYGDIEGIEMFSSKGFAFIKYRKVLSATRAFEQAQGVLADERPVKVAFADPTRRLDIVGDSSAPEDPNFNPIDDDNFKNLYLGFSSSVPSEARLREVFSRYGRVKGIHIKQGPGVARPYAFVDFERGDSAASARKHLYIEDKDGHRRAELGDPALEISFKNTNNTNIRPVKAPLHTERTAVSELARKLMQKMPDVLNYIHTPQLPSFPSVQHPPPPQTEPEVIVEENPNLGNVVWSGFMTRSKRNRVGVDATLLEGSADCLQSNVYHLNITHRVHFAEVTKHLCLGKIALEAANETQADEFREYIRYFLLKDRAGFIQLKACSLYILPPCDLACSLFPKLESSQLLGVFSDPTKKLPSREEETKTTVREDPSRDIRPYQDKPETMHGDRQFRLPSGAAADDPRLRYHHN